MPLAALPMRFVQPGPALLCRGVQIMQVAVIRLPTVSPGPVRRQPITGHHRPLPLLLPRPGQMPHTPGQALRAHRADRAAPTPGPVAVQAEAAARTAHPAEAVLPTAHPAAAAAHAHTVRPAAAAVEADLTVRPAEAVVVQAGQVLPVAVQVVHLPQGDRGDSTRLLKEGPTIPIIKNNMP